MKKKCTALKYYFSISNQNTLKERHHFLTMVRIDNWSQKSQRFPCLWVTSIETNHKYTTPFETGCNHNLFHWDKSSIKINKIPYSEASIITNYFCLNKTHMFDFECIMTQVRVSRTIASKSQLLYSCKNQHQQVAMYRSPLDTLPSHLTSKLKNLRDEYDKCIRMTGT